MLRMIVFRLTSVLAKMQLEIQNQAAETSILKYVLYMQYYITYDVHMRGK